MLQAPMFDGLLLAGGALGVDLPIAAEVDIGGRPLPPHRMRKRRPQIRLSETKSNDHRWLAHLAAPSTCTYPAPACGRQDVARAILPRGRCAAVSCDWASCPFAPADSPDGDNRTGDVQPPVRATAVSRAHRPVWWSDTEPLCGSHRPVGTPDARLTRDAHRQGRRTSEVMRWLGETGRFALSALSPTNLTRLPNWLGS